jgi:hypothetical protein
LRGAQLCDSGRYPVCLLPATGIYTLLASNYNSTATGGYGLSLQRLNAPSGATSIGFGENTLATIVAAGELDTYTFAATSGDSVLVRMGSAVINPHIRLYDPSGQLVCEAHSSSSGNDISGCVLPSDGSYTILINDYSGVNVGGYGMSLQHLNMPGNAVTLSFGETKLATMAQPGETNTYTFTADAQDSVVVRVGSATTLWDPQIRLYGPDGVGLCEAHSSSSGVDIPGCLLPGNGSYTIIVNDYASADTGSYGITLQRVNNPGNAIAAAFGQNSTAVLGAAGELDTYTFTANSSDIVALRMGRSASVPTPQLRLYGPDGVQICEAHHSSVADISGCILPSDGSYTILANAYSSAETGSYGLALQRLNNPLSAAALKYRWPTTGTITVAGGLASYTFSAAANSSVAIQAASPNTSIYPFLRLYAPDGTKLCEAHGYSSGVAISTCPLPIDGTYTLTFSNYSSAATGDFSLFLRCLVDSCGPTDLPIVNVYLPIVQS